jgi:hypothetical protein
MNRKKLAMVLALALFVVVIAAAYAAQQADKNKGLEKPAMEGMVCPSDCPMHKALMDKHPGMGMRGGTGGGMGMQHGMGMRQGGGMMGCPVCPMQEVMGRTSMVTASNHIFVLAGNKLLKYDLNLNLVKEARIKMPEPGMGMPMGRPGRGGRMKENPEKEKMDNCPMTEK